ncbi:MAG TPA: N-acetylmuramoyl-L-alanine amidase-like domain-containing protein [Bacteriovoracaceae bacterium]|nr:N-acetylmuramoyl-L-alanine amidase-like domain-containing protein [Bacteriovoracaceae bacterium]
MLMPLLLLLSLHTVSIAGPREEAIHILDSFKQETDSLLRLDKISQKFLGRPYGRSGPLGEGADGKYDQDPLYRFDTFDCTTFVETMISLAHAKNISEFEKHMDSIRYEDGVVEYNRRNHFTDLQWIPFNTRNGYLKDINEEVLPAQELQVAEALINLPAWIRATKLEQIISPFATEDEKLRQLSELHTEAENFSPVMARVSYIPIFRLLEKPDLLAKIPNGTVINFIRPNWDLTRKNGTNLNVSHQGILFKKEAGLYLRHASSESGIVEEVPLLSYLSSLREVQSLKGIHLMRISLK